ncbi:uncharacterized protein LOC118348406 [Juglans regia]|uniref:Uncharacterized protein LOC118348406 n=1 Tax=Juglans regia TaxID=51240 RepID=A0A6P9EEM9_JUGRE|nr:uncharacterized protein LOC118348406 [Juglans regia]
MRPPHRDEHDQLFENLYKVVRVGNLEETKRILESLPETILNNRFTDKNQTALHIAVLYGHEHIVEELVNKISNEGLAMHDCDGFTALISAAVLGKCRMAECMLQKYPDLISIRDSKRNRLPVAWAIEFRQREMARRLYNLTREEDMIPQDNDQEIQYTNTATLINNAIYIGALGMRTPSSAPAPISETRLNVSNREQRQSNIHEDQNNRSVLSATFRYIVSGVLNLCGITQLMEMKKIHVQYNELISQMCSVISESNTQQRKKGQVNGAILKAAENGNFVLVSKMLEADPQLLWIRDDIKGNNIFMLSVLHRHEKIFSILYGLDTMKTYFTCLQDVDRNSILHMAGMIDQESTRVNQIQGTAFQMQRELQWFKEVERIVYPQFKETTNKLDRLTARQLFTKNHIDMKKKGEKWMKGTALSCTVVGALIITSMFAVAFRQPQDGNNDPRLLMLFIISDALSLFSSSTSVLMFLGILTSRYAEEDFLDTNNTPGIPAHLEASVLNLRNASQWKLCFEVSALLEMIEFIPNLFDLIIVIMNGICGLVLGREGPFELVNSGIIAMTKSRGKINPNITWVGMIFKRIGRRGANRIEDPGKNYILRLVPLGVFGCVRFRRFESVINKTKFVFGIEGSGHGFLPFGIVVAS